MGSRGDLQAKIDQNTETKLREIDVSMGGMHSAVCDAGVSMGTMCPGPNSRSLASLLTSFNCLFVTRSLASGPVGRIQTLIRT